MGYLLNGVKTGGFPFYIIELLLKSIQIPTFVETGTASGDSVREAALYFKECHTIELIEKRQITTNSPDNIHWYTGNSIDVLPSIIEKVKKEMEYCIFSLDAHYSGSELNPGPHKECPLLEEIEVVATYRNAIIVIDDARLFYGSPPWPNDPREWPALQEIFALLLKSFPTHITTIRDDYIICYPEELKEHFDEEWKARYSQRYPSAEVKLKEEVKHVWKSLFIYLNEPS